MRKNFTSEVLDEILLQSFRWTRRNPKAIDLFCGECFQVGKKIISYLDDYTGVDINEEKIQKMKSLYPKQKFLNLDVVAWLKQPESKIIYDIIIIDNPLNIFGSEEQYCEHFELLPYIPRISSYKASIILNVIPRPYNSTHSENLKWLQRRSRFYQGFDITDMNDTLLRDFYIRTLYNSGLKVIAFSDFCREYDNDLDYFHFYYFEVINTTI